MVYSRLRVSRGDTMAAIAAPMASRWKPVARVACSRFESGPGGYGCHAPLNRSRQVETVIGMNVSFPRHGDGEIGRVAFASFAVADASPRRRG